MNNPFLVGVLNCIAEVREEFKSRPCVEFVPIAIVIDRVPLDILHDEVGPAFGCRAGLEDAGDAWMTHHCKRLAFGFEACDDLVRIHARLDDLEGYTPLDRAGLLCEVDDAEAAFADDRENLEWSDGVADLGSDPRWRIAAERHRRHLIVGRDG